MNIKSSFSLSALFVIIAASLWGFDGIVLRPSLSNLPVTLVVLIESSIVAVILTPFFLKKLKGLKELSLKDWLAFVGVALLGGALGTMAITKALFYVNFVNLSIVIFIQKLQPVFALLLAWLLLKERLPKIFFLWATSAILGAYLMTFGFSFPNIEKEGKVILAALFSLLAAFSFGSSTVLSKRALKNVSFEMGTYLRFVITSGIMLLITISSGSIAEIGNVSTTQVFIFLLIAFSTGGPAIFLYYYGLKNISASSSTIFELAFPLTAVLLEYFVHGNILSLSQWVGVAILMFSMFMIAKIKPAV